MRGGDSRRWLVITSSFPRHDRDLAGHFVQEWARGLVRRGHRIDVLCWRGPAAVDRRVERGLTVRFVPYAPPDVEQLFFGAGAPENLDDNPFRGLLVVPAAAAMLQAVMDACSRRDYDGIVGHWLVPGGVVARAAGWLTGTSSAVVGHSGGVHLLAGLPKVVGYPLGRWLVDESTTVPTGPLREKLARVIGVKLSDRVAVAPMGYSPPADTDVCSASSAGSCTRSFGSRDRCPLRLGFLGRLVPIKGLPTVFAALEQLAAEELSVTMEVVGAGPCRDRWEMQAPGNVEFCGPAYGSDKWEYLQRWDGLVMPSKPHGGRHEGLPVSLLEGAGAGAVPLVSGVPGVQKWLAEPDEQAVDGDVDDWVGAIRWLSRVDSDGLVARTQRAVAGLAWPEYAKWWEDWLVEGK